MSWFVGADFFHIVLITSLIATDLKPTLEQLIGWYWLDLLQHCQDNTADLMAVEFS